MRTRQATKRSLWTAVPIFRSASLLKHSNGRSPHHHLLVLSASRSATGTYWVGSQTDFKGRYELDDPPLEHVEVADHNQSPPILFWTLGKIRITACPRSFGTKVSDRPRALGMPQSDWDKYCNASRKSGGGCKGMVVFHPLMTLRAINSQTTAESSHLTFLDIEINSWQAWLFSITPSVGHSGKFTNSRTITMALFTEGGFHRRQVEDRFQLGLATSAIEGFACSV